MPTESLLPLLPSLSPPELEPPSIRRISSLSLDFISHLTFSCVTRTPKSINTIAALYHLYRIGCALTRGVSTNYTNPSARGWKHVMRIYYVRNAVCYDMN